MDIDAIDGLEERIKAIPERPTRPFFGGGVSRMAVSYYDISSELNGSTRTFWVPTNLGIIIAIGSSFPFVFRPVVDFVESGHNIVFDSNIDPAVSLATGQSMVLLIKRN